MRLTKRYIDNLESGDKDYFEWDDELPGFGVRVWPTGRKVYVAQYRFGHRTRRVKIGAHGPLTCEQARREAKGILGEVARGQDPAEDRATGRKSMTVKELSARYLEAADGGLIMGKRGLPKKASTLMIDRGRIKRHILPLLGARSVRELNQADVYRFLRDISSGKTAVVEKTDKPRGKAVVEGGLGTATRTVGLLGSILSFAVSEGVIDRNPVHGVKRPADKYRQRRLTAEEYGKLGKALSDADEFVGQARTGIWLLALTGCRLGEIERLRWSEVDITAGCLRLMESKEGTSVRPVGKAALRVLEEVPKDKGRPFVLAGVRSEGSFGGLPGAFEKMMKRAGLEGVTPHTLRHSFASVAGDLGFTETTIAALLGHGVGTVTSRYVHHLVSVLIAAADRVAGEVYRQLTLSSAR